MTEINHELQNLVLVEPIFKGIKFYLSGQCNEKAIELLKNGGAERMNYFSDYVTHLLCGQNCEETDVCDATDLYEIPAIIESWVYISARLKTLASTKPFLYNPNKLFTNLIFCFSNIGSDLETLWSMITYYGGTVQLNLNISVTHLITIDLNTEKSKRSLLLSDYITIVTPDWIVESIRANNLVQSNLFHPKLILWPKIIKKHDTTSITGFEPDVLDKEIAEASPAESTQALLDKLKQRMPWNQPDVAPPNVIAPSYIAPKTPEVSQHLFSPTSQLTQSTSITTPPTFTPQLLQPQNQLPRSIVHHTPQNPPPQYVQSSFVQANQNNPNFNRILEQLQQRPQMQPVNRINQQQFVQNKANLMLPNQQQAAQNVVQTSVTQMLTQNQGNLLQRNALGQIVKANIPNQQILQQQLVNRQLLAGNKIQNQMGQQILQSQQQRIMLGQQNILLQKQLQNQQNQQQTLQNQQQTLQNQQQQTLQNQQLLQGQQLLQNQQQIGNQQLSGQQQVVGQLTSQQQLQNQLEQHYQIQGQQLLGQSQQQQTQNLVNQNLVQLGLSPQALPISQQGNQNLGQVNQNLGQVNQNLGQVNQSLGQVNQNLGQVNQNLGQVSQSLVQQNMGQQSIQSQNIVQSLGNMGISQQSQNINISQQQGQTINVSQQQNINIVQLAQSQGLNQQQGLGISQNLGIVQQQQNNNMILSQQLNQTQQKQQMQHDLLSHIPTSIAQNLGLTQTQVQNLGQQQNQNLGLNQQQQDNLGLASQHRQLGLNQGQNLTLNQSQGHQQGLNQSQNLGLVGQTQQGHNLQQNLGLNQPQQSQNLGLNQSQQNQNLGMAQGQNLGLVQNLGLNQVQGRTLVQQNQNVGLSQSQSQDIGLIQSQAQNIQQQNIGLVQQQNLQQQQQQQNISIVQQLSQSQQGQNLGITQNLGIVQQQNMVLQQNQQVIGQTQLAQQKQQHMFVGQQNINLQQSKIIQNQFGQVLQGQQVQQVLGQQQQQVLTQQNQSTIGQQQTQQQFVSSSNQNFPQQQQQQTQHFIQGNQQQFSQASQLLQQQGGNQGQFVQQSQQGGNSNMQQLLSHQLQQKQAGNQQQLLISQGLNQGGQQQLPQFQNKPVQQQQQQQQQQQPGQPVQQNQQPRGPIWQQQINIRHPNQVNIVQQGPRVQWAGNQQQPPVQRQFIQLDAQTHQQLQQMAPEERAIFVQKLQKQRQLILQRQQLQMQQQRGGHILIRSSGPVPAGLNPQQQMQWLQQQAKQQGVVLQPNIQQQQSVQQQQQAQQQPPQSATPSPQIQQQQHGGGAPGLSPIQQGQPFSEQNQQMQLQRQQLRMHQIQLQREQVHKNAAALQPLQQQQQQQQGGVIARAQIGQPQPMETNQAIDAPQSPLVNAKTKTALANMLSIRLQSGGSTMGPGSETISEPSAAGTLRLMTAQHNANLNSNNRPQEIMALQQQQQQQQRARVITAPASEVARPPAGPTPVPQSPQADAQKLQYSPRSVLPIQHRPGMFYGHNPNLKLPPDLFLLGCIFVVVELERFLDDSLPGWQRKIEKHGGEIEKQYCSRVTHVLCETQRHGVVMQALRDCKRCVTLYWLSDVMNRKQVLPPWTALHLPTMYLDTVPASKHLISLTGFAGTERERVKHMIKYTGASFTNYFSKHNTLLIATKAEGPKYMHAKKWGIPVVNIQWLTDVMLGNFSALNQAEHIKYQQFATPPNFSFDPILVPNLMHGWKMPINISQESYERVKRSASPVAIPPKMKKLKTEPADENGNWENMPQSATHRIVFTRCVDVNELKKAIGPLGGSVAKSPMDATHLVLPQLARTNKLLQCVCLGVKIVSEAWLRDSSAANTFLDEAPYALDTKEFNSNFKCDFTATLATRNRNKLLEGKFFFITPSVFPNKKSLTELIQSCSGIVERTRRTLSQIEATNINSPYSYIILTHENDLHLVADLLKNKKDKIRIVCNVELILSAVLKQTFEVDPYVVKVV